MTTLPYFCIFKVERHHKSDGNRFNDAFFLMKRSRKKKTNFGDLQEKALNWIWVVLLISGIMFLKGLLGDMNTQTNRLSEERKLFQEELNDERIKSKELYEDFYAELNKTIQKAMGTIDMEE